MPERPVTSSELAWEAAYVRFETPEQEVQKFLRRLRGFGANQWPRNASILELFCGRGNGLVAWERLGFTRVTGVDLSPRLIAHYKGDAKCVVADCRALPFSSQAYDIVIVQGGLHHLPTLPGDLERVLDEARRVLVGNGLFIVVEPWRTPFLDVVHYVSFIGPVRRLWDRMDAFATMTEHESDTYFRWLGSPSVIQRALASRFDVKTERHRLGKLLFAGHPRR